MAMPKYNYIYGPKLRLCQVGEELGYFHIWEQTSSVVEPSLMVGGHPGGTVAQVYALVEFSDGSIRRVQLYEVKFVDETHDILQANKRFFKVSRNE